MKITINLSKENYATLCALASEDGERPRDHLEGTVAAVLDDLAEANGLPPVMPKKKKK